MLQCDLEVYLNSLNGNEFLFSKYQFYNRFGSTREILENERISRAAQNLGKLKIIGSETIEENVKAGGVWFFDLPNLNYRGLENGMDITASSGNGSLDDLSDQSASSRSGSESESHIEDSNNIETELSSSISFRERSKSAQTPKSTAAEWNSIDSAKNPPEPHQEDSTTDNTIQIYSVNVKSDEALITSNPTSTPVDVLIKESLPVSSNELPLGIPGNIAKVPYSDGGNRSFDFKASLLKLKKKWVGNQTFEGLKMRVKSFGMSTIRKIRDHNETLRFFPAFKFKKHSLDGEFNCPTETLLVEDLLKGLCACFVGNGNGQIPFYFCFFYEATCNEAISSAKNFLIPLIFDSVSIFEDMGESMYNFITDVEHHINIMVESNQKKFLRDQVECMRKVFGSLEDISSAIMNSVAFLMQYSLVLKRHIFLAAVLPVNVTSVNLLLAFRDFFGYALKDVVTLLTSNFKRWNFFLEKSEVVLSYLVNEDKNSTEETY